MGWGMCNGLLASSKSAMSMVARTARSFTAGGVASADHARTPVAWPALGDAWLDGGRNGRAGDLVGDGLRAAGRGRG